MKKWINTFWKFIRGVVIATAAALLIALIIDAILKMIPKSDENQLKELKKQKEAYNKGVKRSIKNEKWIYIVARTLIAILLIVGNIFLYNFYSYQKNWEDILGLHMNVNGALILSYGFVAFLLAGTPTKFVKLLRTSIYRWRRWSNLPVDVNIDEVNKEIKILEDKKSH